MNHTTKTPPNLHARTVRLALRNVLRRRELGLRLGDALGCLRVRLLGGDRVEGAELVGDSAAARHLKEVVEELCVFMWVYGRRGQSLSWV